MSIRARATVVVTAGPGATNVVTEIVSAHLEGVPLLLICGDVAWAAGGGRLLQDSGPEGIAVEMLLANVTRATVRVHRQGRSWRKAWPRSAPRSGFRS